MNVLVSLAFFLVGLIMYLMARPGNPPSTGNHEVMRIGEIFMFCGLLAFLLQLGPKWVSPMPSASNKVTRQDVAQNGIDRTLTLTDSDKPFHYMDESLNGQPSMEAVSVQSWLYGGDTYKRAYSFYTDKLPIVRCSGNEFMRNVTCAVY